MFERHVTATLLVVAGILGGCAQGATVPVRGALDEDVDAADLVPYSNEKFDGALATFDADLILDDALFENADAVTVESMQALLEFSPYQNRSFLADESVNGKPFSQVIVEVAQAHQLNPMLLLVRVQVETSLVSKSERPGNGALDFALGCGCPDGSSCSESMRGLDAQLDCAAQTLRTRFDDSADGSGQWTMGEARETLDGESVTPGSHGTAALYAYTPWVLEGSGGNWLVWNVSRKYIGTMLDRGTYDVDEPMDDEPDPEQTGSCADHCGSISAVPLGDGEACFCDADCVANGDCCDDYSDECGDDEHGTSTGEDDGGSTGGDDGSSSDDGAADPDAPSCDGACGSPGPISDGQGGFCYCDAGCVQLGDCCGDYDAAC